MLTTERIESILNKLPFLTIGVVGDLFLDQYLHIEQSLSEPSLETGLDAFQVVRITSSPGAAGTVLNNLASLGVGSVRVLSCIGADGRGFELKRELLQRGIRLDDLIESSDRFTPTYTKPMLEQGTRELNRLDIKNRTPLPLAVEDVILDRLLGFYSACDALIAVDQVSEPNCGVITDRVRTLLGKLAQASTGKLLLADSRERIHHFQHCAIKPNLRECQLAYSRFHPNPTDDKMELLDWLESQKLSPIFCTQGGNGIILRHQGKTIMVPAYHVEGPIDPVGAGDSTSAGIASAYATGATFQEAASFGNLIASITIQQLGTTGVANSQDVKKRWQELSNMRPFYS